MKPYPTQIPAGNQLPHYTEPGNFTGEFRRPTADRMPRMRWWVPSTFLDKKGIEKNIESMAKAGFSGAEVVPMPRFDVPGELSIDWGTPNWKELSKFMLETAARYNFTIDFTMTPFWPLALPCIKDAADPKQGAQMEADSAYIDGITKNNPYSGVVPIPPQAVKDAEGVQAMPKLVAVTYAKYLDKNTKTLQYSSAKSLKLGEDVLPDVSDSLTWKVSLSPEDDGEYVLFGWWEHPSGNKTCQNLQLDHYGRGATQVLIDYWEKNLIPYYGEEFIHTAALFIDSLEYQTHLDWTHGFLETFMEQNKYDLAPYLPALYDHESPGCFVKFPEPDFRFEHNNKQIINDYYEFLTQLYIENHLKPLTSFCEKYNIAMRYQTSYGKNLELAQTAMYISIPETETLYGGDILDFYRLQSGAVHLSRKKIYSIEASAEMNTRGNGGINSGNYQQTWGNQLWHIQRAMSCGVNQIVFHGYSYEGYFEGDGNENGFLPGAHWPGHTTFGYSEFSNNWSACQPNWLHVNQYTDFLARTQYILRQGESKIDLAIYQHSYEEIIDFNGAVKLYPDDGLLEQLGYTYDFISSASMALPHVNVSEYCLDENGAAYKAFILADQAYIPYETAKTLLEYALSGLPVVIAGEIPGCSAFHQDEDISPIIAKLLTVPCVQQVDTLQEVPDALIEFGVLPNAMYEKRSCILNVCRSMEEADFYFFYNYGDADTYPQAQVMPETNTTVTIYGKGYPYRLNAWTGDITPVAGFISAENSVTIDLELGKNESCIFALIRNPEIFASIAPAGTSAVAAMLKASSISVPVRHITTTGFWSDYDDKGNLRVKSKNETSAEIPLSNGKTVQIAFSHLPEKITLSGWDLVLEKWSESDIPSESTKTIHAFPGLKTLIPWKELPGMEFASGIGTYKISFRLDHAWEEKIGYLLELGDICDSYSVEVNAHPVPANQLNTTIDIGQFLRCGENTIVVTVASTLLNALLDYSHKHTLKSGTGKLDERTPDAYGILNDVTLIPYGWESGFS